MVQDSEETQYGNMKTEEEIWNYIRSKKQGTWIEDIARKTGRARPTVARYVSVLQSQGKIEVTRWGATLRIIAVQEAGKASPQPSGPSRS